MHLGNELIVILSERKAASEFIMIIARKLIFKPSQIIYSELKKMKNLSSEIMMMTLWERFHLTNEKIKN